MVDLDLWDLTNVVSAPMECDSNKDSVQSNFCVLCRVCKEVSCEESKTIVYICRPWWYKLTTLQLSGGLLGEASLPNSPPGGARGLLTYTFITDWSGAKIKYTVHVDLPKHLDWIVKVGNRSHCLYRFLDNQKNTRSQFSIPGLREIHRNLKQK